MNEEENKEENKEENTEEKTTEKTTEETIEDALDFEKKSMGKMSASDRVSASREAKALVLRINEIYKKTQDPSLMDLMKLVTKKKQKIDKRLNYRST
ncbi:MAG: hypothetical protein ACI84C_002266 [Flavobacteriales bacterium]|jgi:hypothetical protein